MTLTRFILVSLIFERKGQAFPSRGDYLSQTKGKQATLDLREEISGTNAPAYFTGLFSEREKKFDQFNNFCDITWAPINQRYY